MRTVVLLFLALLATPQAGWAGDDGACGSAISAASAGCHAAVVMKAIATVESGRPIGNRVVPWPWSVNAAGGATSTGARKRR